MSIENAEPITNYHPPERLKQLSRRALQSLGEKVPDDYSFSAHGRGYVALGTKVDGQSERIFWVEVIDDSNHGNNKDIRLAGHVGFASADGTLDLHQIKWDKPTVPMSVEDLTTLAHALADTRDITH